jgi:DNA repair protein RadC
MQNLMIKSGSRYRKATAAEVAEVAGQYALDTFNRARPTLDAPSQAVTYLTQMYAGRDAESFTVLFLDNRHRLIECVEMFRGTINGAAVYPREVVKAVLWKGAAAVIIAHNHPSGLASPSEADLLITRRLREALALIEVQILDHLIIGANGSHFSMAERGLI